MEHPNYGQNQLVPLSSRLKGDTTRYERFINHPSIKNVYAPSFLDSFFTFIDDISSKDPAEQERILEMPSEYGIRNEFMAYNAIFESFLQVYGDAIIKSQDTSRFNHYQNIILKSENDFIKQSKSDIADAIDPNKIYVRYESYLQKYEIGFKEQCDLIGQYVGHNTRALGTNSGLSITDIIDTLADLDDENKKGYHLYVQNNYFRPFLLENIQICQQLISKKDTEKSQEETQNDAINIYNQMIDYLSKQEYPIKLHIDETFFFTRPILNNIDFDRLYHELLSFVANERSDPEYIYLETYKTRNSPINAIKFPYVDEDGNFLSPIDYISEKIDIGDSNEEEGDDEGDDEENDPIEQLIYSTQHTDDSSLTEEELDEMSDMIGGYIDKRSDERDENNKKQEIKVLNEVRKELPQYYQIDTYIGFDQEELLPTFTIQLNQYTNKFDSDNKWISVEMNPKPIIIKSTFCIGNTYINPTEYISHFVNFMDHLSPDYDCLKMLGITDKDL